jgi:hypothetical protein
VDKNGNLKDYKVSLDGIRKVVSKKNYEHNDIKPHIDNILNKVSELEDDKNLENLTDSLLKNIQNSLFELYKIAKSGKGLKLCLEKSLLGKSILKCLFGNHA